MSLLEIKNVNIAYNTGEKKVWACRNISLDINEEESVGIVGESGSGKSTLAMGILRLLPENIIEVSGEALLEGKDNEFALSGPSDRKADGRYLSCSLSK